MLQTLVFTHRGLQPATPNFFAESSYEAFFSQLEQGFNLEFDFNLTKDEQIVICHDPTLKRLTHGKDQRAISNLTAAELRNFSLHGNTICFFADLVPLLQKSPAPLHAFHIKGSFQTTSYLQVLIRELQKYPSILPKLLLFDLQINPAAQIQKVFPNLQLAPSVAHPYDIQRYNQAVKGTLLSIEETIQNKDLFSWVWLDEWDLSAETGQKKFYTAENFAHLRNQQFKIALVTPELHGASPGLLGGEAHPDAAPFEKLMIRIKEILALQPDAVCTDYPQEVKNLLVVR